MSSFHNKAPACWKCGADIGEKWMLCYVEAPGGGFGEYKPFHYDCAPEREQPSGDERG